MPLQGPEFEMPAPHQRSDQPFPAPSATREDIETSLMPRGGRQRPLPLTSALRVRQATHDDLAGCVRMAVRFAQAPPYGALLPANVGAIAQLITFVLEHGAGFVAQQDDGALVGMIGASIAPHAFTGELVASEAAWWMDAEHRGGSSALRLLDAIERWARAQGAVRFQMIAPAGETRLRDLYLRRDYAELETIYQRVL